MILGLDPLFTDGVDIGDVGWVLVKVIVIFVFLMVAVMLNIWFLRKVIADFQNRIGPSVAGKWGILQSLADGIKLFMKEDLVPEKADRFVFKLAPYLSLVPAFLVFAIVPLGGDFNKSRELADGTVETGALEWGDNITYLQLADPPVGILFFLAMSSLAIYGIMLAGWGSGSKYPLLGSVRASAQMVSYEAALGLAIAAVVLISGSLSTHDIVAQQAAEGWFGIVPRWNLIVTAFVPFIIFLIAGTAELNHPPFDLVEAEQELVGGFHTEYSSIRFALFFLAEFMNQITMSAIAVTLFLGGPAGPVLFGPAWIWGIIWFFAKTMFFLWGLVWVRATLPRFRYDQLMDLGWKVLIPLALAWFLLLAGIQVGQDRGWDGQDEIIFIAVFAGACLLMGSLLMAAIKTARQERLEREGVDQHG
ncbi:MAG: NADH-quinone oxidoreductase subunit NuoH [Acidimicrobiales bacterium]|jgi:NADH-quinone oxidoreductase subunit H|nr:NADH-quinone oxidoreductase subunit NuoH [Acidimicrobiales bacterium]